MRADLTARPDHAQPTSVGQGEGSPVTFYERYGFKRTGDFHGNDIILRLEIS